MKENRTSCMQIGQADPKPFSLTRQVSDLQIIIYYNAEKELIKGTEGIFSVVCFLNVYDSSPDVSVLFCN